MERFIEAVRQYPCLWNVSIKEYRNIDIKEAAWKSIVDDVNLAEIKTIQDAKSEWKKLRDNHRDSLKRMKATRSGQAATNLNTWRYAELMEFLLPYMKNRSRSTNLNSSDIRSSATPETSIAQDDEDTNNSEISVVPTNDTMNNTEASAPQGGKTQRRKRTADEDFIELLKEMEENHQKRQEERDVRRTMTKTQEKGAIDFFLESMAITIKTMPMWMQNRVKKKIFLIVSDAEEELENYSTCVTPDSVNNTLPAAAASSRSANYGYTTSRDPVNNNLPAAVAGSSRSANYVYTLPEAEASRSNNTTYHGYSSSGRFEPSPLHDYDN